MDCSKNLGLGQIDSFSTITFIHYWPFIPYHLHPDTALYLLHILICGLHVGHCPPQPVSLLGPTPTLSPSFQLAQAIFKPNLFPYKYPNILNPSYSSYLPTYEDGTDSVLKHWHVKFRRQGITQKKAYNIQYTAKVWNQEFICSYTLWFWLLSMFIHIPLAVPNTQFHSNWDDTQMPSLTQKLETDSEHLNIGNHHTSYLHEVCKSDTDLVILFQLLQFPQTICHYNQFFALFVCYRLLQVTNI